MNDTGCYEVRRTFDATAEEVFRFFVEPAAFSQWFVVPGFRTPRESVRMDARPDGSVEATMVGEDGAVELPFTVRFGDLDPPRRIVLYPGENEEVTVTLAVVPEGTELRYAYRGPAAGPGDVAAVEAMLDRIGQHL